VLLPEPPAPISDNADWLPTFRSIQRMRAARQTHDGQTRRYVLAGLVACGLYLREAHILGALSDLLINHETAQTDAADGQERSGPAERLRHSGKQIVHPPKPRTQTNNTPRQQYAFKPTRPNRASTGLDTNVKRPANDPWDKGVSETILHTGPSGGRCPCGVGGW
jgi:hypothetical protein